ncbi:hypothetical protein BOTBODRAFT_181422 [Botryobasidium botryosum FD-172 SS1]|uniref:Uncharacterized protein n=1 Tax=Botryobasidium botryosum (strain FD-172 SS1) TaxID=930990 RepID=A0A067M3Z2_BOTB1|nr:hypothetical protein BOTBODRAFT_181422 [Botryobasidium botryosum FD-172 SS1]
MAPKSQSRSVKEYFSPCFCNTDITTIAFPTIAIFVQTTPRGNPRLSADTTRPRLTAPEGIQPFSPAPS